MAFNDINTSLGSILSKLAVPIFLLVAGAYLQVNYDKLFGIDTFVYRLMSSPLRFHLLAFALILVVILMWPRIISRSLTNASRAIIFYGFRNEVAGKPTFLSLAHLALLFGAAAVSQLLVWFIVLCYTAAFEWRYDELYQRQRMLLNANALLEAGELDRSLEVYQSILDNSIGPETYNYELSNFIATTKAGYKLYQSSKKQFEQSLDKGEYSEVARHLVESELAWEPERTSGVLKGRFLNAYEESSETFEGLQRNCNKIAEWRLSEPDLKGEVLITEEAIRISVWQILEQTQYFTTKSAIHIRSGISSSSSVTDSLTLVGELCNPVIEATSSTDLGTQLYEEWYEHYRPEGN